MCIDIGENIDGSIYITKEEVNNFIKNTESKEFTEKLNRIIKENKKVIFCGYTNLGNISNLLSLIDNDYVHYCMVVTGKRLNGIWDHSYFGAKILLDNGFFYINGNWNFSKKESIEGIKNGLFDPLMNKFNGYLFQYNENLPCNIGKFNISTVKEIEQYNIDMIEA